VELLGSEHGLFRRELMKGSTETLILSLLAEESMYGYQLVREVERRSSGYFRLKEGTLYPALHRIERDGLVRSTWVGMSNGHGRRYYAVTEAGHQRLEAMLREWDRFAAAVNLVAQPASTLARAALQSR
jgi:PadR family transcriptional regulator PadR